MSSFTVLLWIVLVLTVTSTVNAICAQCSATSYAACINETAFVVCYDGQTASTQIGVCGAGKVCTGRQGICVTKADDVFPECVTAFCNKCVNQFACVSQTEFSFCDANGPTDLIAACPSGQYCSIEEFMKTSKMCALSCLVTPSCSNTEVTTLAPIDRDWAATCNSATAVAPGYNKNIQDSTCKTYVYCENLNNVMYAIFYTCSTGYFNQATQKCVATKPSDCT